MDAEPSTRLYLLRHAEVEEKYHVTFGGTIDMTLSDRGHSQATALADYLQDIPFQKIYSSPMIRARETIAPLARRLNHCPIIMEDLREIDFGSWTGLHWDEVYSKYRLSAFDWLHHLETGTIPQAEPIPVFRRRIEACLAEIFNNCKGQTVGMLSHGGVIRMILSILLDIPLHKKAGFEIHYASVSIAEIFPHKNVVQLLNFTPWRDLPARPKS